MDRSKKYIIAAGVLLGAAGAATAQTFEGTVTLAMGGKNAQPMSYSVKGSKLRMEMPGMEGAFIVRDGDQMSIVMPQQKMYMVQSLQAAQAMAAQQTAPTGRTTVTPTGKKETIAGYECEHYLIASGKDQFDACIAKGLGSFMAPSNPMGGRANPNDAVLSKIGPGGFPLRVQKVGGDVIMEVTKIEKKSLDESLFTVPSDYHKMDMGGMMGRPPGE